jgi:hypothetical protein
MVVSLWRGCLVLSVAALSFAGYSWIRNSDRESRSLTIDPASVEYFDRPVGSYDLVFRFDNRSHRQIHIVGLESGCGQNCCFTWNLNYHIEVPPKEGVALSCQITLQSPGPFKATMTVFVDDYGLQRYPLAISGSAAAKGSVNDITPSESK